MLAPGPTGQLLVGCQGCLHYRSQQLIPDLCKTYRKLSDINLMTSVTHSDLADLVFLFTITMSSDGYCFPYDV